MATSKPAFEHVTCSRCGGSGHYSFNLMYGTVCFKCHGRGWCYTKRGAAANTNTLQEAKDIVRAVRTVLFHQVDMSKAL
jgi:DnaJ-class molecular chaperone